MIALTAKQNELLAYLRCYLNSTGGVAPSFDEMMSHFGINSRGTLFNRLRALEERGRIRRSPNRARAIEIVDVGPLHTVSTADLIAELERRRVGSVQTNPEAVGV